MIHTYLANILFKFLDNIYYKNLKIASSLSHNPESSKNHEQSSDFCTKKELSTIFHYSNISIIKPEYFIYANYYFIYLFFHYMNPNNVLIYSFFLHINYINDLLCDKMLLNYNYVPKNDIVFLKQCEKILFQYLFFFKIYFLENISPSKKFYIIFLQNLFHFLVNIHDIYKQRLLYIKTKNNDKYMNKNILKLFILSPDKKIIEKITHSICFATYSNYLFFLNIVLYLFL